MPKKGSVFGAPPAAVVEEGEEQLTLDELSNALGPVNDLPPIVRRRVDALTNLHKQYLGVQKQFQAELAELEKKYQKLYEPVLDKREQIVSGTHEPTDEEAKVEKKEGEEEEEEGKKREAKPEDANIKGIPQYWLTVLQNNIHISQTIYENDEDALAYLKDIRSAELEGAEEQGFTLTFHFAENPYFTNTTLTKTYYMAAEDEYFGEPMLERVTGAKINWKPGKNLTVTQVKKKIKAKGKKPAKVITVDEPAPSFFTFFSPPQLGEDDEEEPDPEAEDALEADFDLGCIIKEKLIPHSVLWFTGEAARFEDEYDDFDGEEDDEDEGEEDTDEDEEEEEEEPPKKGRRGPGGPGHNFNPPPGAAKGGAGAPAQPQQPECKQQ